MDRLEAMDIRLRAVEGAVIELGVMARSIRMCVVFLGMIAGVDVVGMV